MLHHASSTLNTKPPTVLVYEAPKTDTPIKPSQSNPVNNATVHASSASPVSLNKEDGVKQIKRDEATVALMKLLNIKPQKKIDHDY